MDTKNLPASTSELQNIILNLHRELSNYKLKYTNLLEQIQLAKQKRFASSSEKIYFSKIYLTKQELNCQKK